MVISRDWVLGEMGRCWRDIGTNSVISQISSEDQNTMVIIINKTVLKKKKGEK